MRKRAFLTLSFVCVALLAYAQQSKAGKEFVPAWAKSVIWYQIFPERFHDGDKNNNPTIQDIAGADPAEPAKAWQIHPWGSDWYELQPYEKQNGEKELYKHLLRRRYGGDLQGIINKLAYLKGLGITGIYLNPVFDAPSLHKYDGASYHHIDPNFGPDPTGDRAMMAKENVLDSKTWVWTKADELALKLIDEAHKLGIKIIFDGVFNHMGVNSFAFQDVLKNQEKSAYKDWFIIKSWNNAEKKTTFDYEGWFGVKSLPELREDANGIVASPKQYIFNATHRWMNPKNKGAKYGIDGWRLDVAFCVAHPFWKDWRKHVQRINPQAYMTAEIVDTPEKVKPYMQGDEFDGEMNYNFAFTCAEFFFNPKAMHINATEFDKKLQELRELYPKGVAEVSMNLFGSHDANRIGSHIVNRGIANYRDWGKYYGTSMAINNPKYSPRKPQAQDIVLQKLFVLMQMTYTGAPMVYYGDEVGMWGSNDPDCRKPMVWSDMLYNDEVYAADATTKHAPDKVEISQDLLGFYKKMIALRNQSKALQIGNYKTLFADNEKNIFAFQRTHKKENVIVILNNADKEIQYEIPNLKEKCYQDALSGKSYTAAAGKITLPIKPKYGVILIACNKY